MKRKKLSDAIDELDPDRIAYDGELMTFIMTCSVPYYNEETKTMRIEWNTFRYSFDMHDSPAKIIRRGLARKAKVMKEIETRLSKTDIP